MNHRSTVAIILALVAAVCAVVVFMDVREPATVLAAGLLALAVGLIVVSA